MGEGIRIAGTAEYARLDAPADDKRAWMLLEKAKSMLQPFDTRDAGIWMGQRPSLPDYIPAISTTPHCRGVIYAFGHGHLGLTLGATTGRLVAELAAGHTPALDMNPYRIDRF